MPNCNIEYKVFLERLDGTKTAIRYFTDKRKTLRYAYALEKKYPYLVVHMIEI